MHSPEEKLLSSLQGIITSAARSKLMSGLARLDDDGLISMLLRAPGSMHPVLARVSPRFLKIVHSNSFASGRARLELSEVRTCLDPKEYDDSQEERDDDDPDPLGFEASYSCTRRFMGRVLADGRQAGSFECILIDREQAHSLFFSACDAESQELIDIGNVLFDQNGSARYQPLKADADSAGGGFLYISVFQLDSKHRADGASTHVASNAITHLLQSPQLRRRWQVAAYIGDERDAHSMMQSRSCEAPSHEEQYQRNCRSNRRLTADCRPFVRVHFNEIQHLGTQGWLYTTKTLQQGQPLTHQQAMLVPLKSAEAPVPVPAELQGPDKELREWTSQICSTFAFTDEYVQSKVLREVQVRTAAMTEQRDQIERDIASFTAELSMRPGNLESRAGELETQLLAVTDQTQLSEVQEQLNGVRQASARLCVEYQERVAAVGARQEAFGADSAKLQEEFGGANAHAKFEEAKAARKVGLYQQLDVLIDAGANIDRSHSLHCATAFKRIDLMCALLDRGATVNARDVNSMTPLMIAAGTLGDKAPGVPDTRCLDELLGKGADRKLTEPHGRTALGMYRCQVKSTDDFRSALTDELRQGPNSVVEAMLRPFGGPTLADESYL